MIHGATIPPLVTPEPPVVVPPKLRPEAERPPESTMRSQLVYPLAPVFGTPRLLAVAVLSCSTPAPA